MIGDNIIPANGNVPIAVTDIHDIGHYVARIITDPRTLNKMVFAYNEVVTFNQAFEFMEERSSEHVDRNYISDGVLMNAVDEMKERMQNDKTDQLAVYKAYWYQYFYSCGVRGDNTPYVAEYLGYLNAKYLYPDFKGLSFGKYLTISVNAMPYTVLIFAYRKPGLTPEEFKNHYENVHVPLIKSIAGDKFPLSHPRSYINRTESKEDQGNSFPATVLAATQDDFCYDAIS
ncbi:hypothetical protein SLS56_005447 [Neofusicoccum ribis]|uniref:EthD domain-containing protein n=1 Tax=Neofusicoccum ribis TaxID=45134 RepID=A0ABR3STG3_9PEZI